MEDKQIIELYWARAEAAVSETASKYGRYCHYIANNILHNDQDSEECVNDTYMRAWCSIPPKRPSVFKVFLGTITRNLSLNRCAQLSAEKRGAGQAALVFDELQECVPAGDETEKLVDDIVLAEALNRFLASLSPERRKIFMRRYWYFSPVKEIAGAYGVTESKVKMSLARSRYELRKHLEREGVFT